MNVVMNIIISVLTKFGALLSFLSAIWKKGGRDVFYAFIVIAIIVGMLSLSFAPGECDGEFSPVLCIDVYKLVK